MRTTETGHRIFRILSVLSPVLCLLMYCPVWNGKELTCSGALPTILFVFQGLCLLYSLVRLCLEAVLKRNGGKVWFGFDLAPVVSIILTVFYGFVFILKILGVPWFPVQS